MLELVPFEPIPASLSSHMNTLSFFTLVLYTSILLERSEKNVNNHFSIQQKRASISNKHFRVFQQLYFPQIKNLLWFHCVKQNSKQTWRNGCDLLIINDAMKSNTLEELYILLVIVVVSPAEHNQGMLKGHLDLAWIAHQVLCVYVYSLKMNGQVMQTPNLRGNFWISPPHSLPLSFHRPLPLSSSPTSLLRYPSQYRLVYTVITYYN